jgi:hypothetical protein
MKIRNVNAAMLTDMLKLWNETSPARQDDLRSQETLRYLMLEDGGDSQWYVVEPSTVITIRGIQPGLTANFLIMNGEPGDYPAIKRELQGIMREYDLRRLTWTTPACVNEWAEVARRLGFVPEGRLKDGITFDNHYSDSNVFGLHRGSVESYTLPAISGKAAEDLAPRKKRRRRRSRRKKKSVDQTHTIPAPKINYAGEDHIRQEVEKKVAREMNLIEDA